MYKLNHTESGSLKVNLVSKNSKLITEKLVKVVRPTSSDSPATDGPSPASTVTTVPSSQLMYGDEETTPFFRRLAFSADGSLLITPAGIYDDPNASNRKKGKGGVLEPMPDGTSPSAKTSSSKASSPTAPSSSTGKQRKLNAGGPSPTAYIFARGQLANETPVANLPGHRTTSIVVRFNPVLWNLRRKRGSSPATTSFDEGKGKGRTENGVDPAPRTDGEGGHAVGAQMEVDIDTPEVTHTSRTRDASDPTSPTQEGDGGLGDSVNTSPDSPDRASKAPPFTSRSSVFQLEQRTIYAVATHETILIYDTQQPSPICLFGSLHFAAFTDLAW